MKIYVEGINKTDFFSLESQIEQYQLQEAL